MNRQCNVFIVASFTIWLILAIILIPTIFIIMFNSIFLLEWVFASMGARPISFIIIADKNGLIFSCVVLFISANVLRFSTLYMKDDKYTNRFTILVLLFILSINILIFLPHLIVLLLGWDGLGLVSFILVIYYQNPSSIAARILTALTNRLGDVAILLSIGITLNQGHWLIINIDLSSSWLPIQVILIACAAITKSAQIPFSRWLPAAIAAPTPVSALVHSSTLVTAGVFLLIRFYPMLHTFRLFNPFIIIIATSTTFIAGLSANTECDLKKIVALSTLSQLGVIIFSLGINMPHLAYFHIITHALFKALLFVCVGRFINYHNHAQDLRWIGNLTYQIPTVISCIIVANIALSGFPFLAGFYSKDIIIEFIISSQFNSVILIITLLSLGLTSFYSIRATLVAIIRNQISLPFSLTAEPLNITKPVLILSTSAILIGGTLIWVSSNLLSYSSTLSITSKLIPLALILTGVFLAWIKTSNTSNSTALLIKHQIINYARCIIWFIVPLSTQFTIRLPFLLTHNFIKSIDQGWFEHSSGQGINKLAIINTNIIYNYTPSHPTTYILISVIIILTIIIITVL